MVHFILTEETYNLKHYQTIELMHQNIETLLSRIDELQLGYEFMEDLILHDEEEKKRRKPALIKQRLCTLLKYKINRYLNENERSNIYLEAFSGTQNNFR